MSMLNERGFEKGEAINMFVEKPEGIKLKTPVTEKAAKKIQSGDVLYITGHVWTVREGGIHEEPSHICINLSKIFSLIFISETPLR